LSSSLLSNLIIRLEDFHALFQEGVLVIFDEGGTYAQTFLFGATGDEADGRHAVVHQLDCQASSPTLVPNNQNSLP